MSASTIRQRPMSLQFAARASCRVASSLGNRARLWAAAVKVKAQPTRSRPRNLVFSCPPIVFIQPKASSIRLRMRWLTAYPACRVVRPSIADDRPLVFCATCRRVHRAQLIDEVLGVVGLVGAQRDRLRPIGGRLDHVQSRDPHRMAVGLRHTGVDQKAVAVSISACPMKQSWASLPGPLR